MIYGITFSTSFILALFVVWRLYKYNLAFIRFGVSLDTFFDSVLVFFFAFGLGARILYIAQHWDSFAGNVISWFLFLHFPGFAFLGGVVGGIIGLWIFCRRKKLPFLLLLDVLFVALPLALGFSRIGNLLVGEDQRFPIRNITVAVGGYEAVLAFAIFVLLYMLYMRGKSKPGMIAIYCLLLIGVLAFFVEMGRGVSVYLLHLTIGQIISACFVITSTVLILVRKRETLRAMLKGRGTRD